MSWEFFNSKDIKHTRKKHQCILCGRKIPIGKPAFNYSGKYDGDMQNSYICMFCKENIELSRDEEISDWGQEFSDWLYEQDFMKCKCGERYSLDWTWVNNHEDIEIECGECEKQWAIHIGWGKEVDHE